MGDNDHKRYCPSCESLQPVEGGKKVGSNNRMRWRCKKCIDRANASRSQRIKETNCG